MAGVALAALAAAQFFGWPPFQGEPSYYRTGGIRYACHHGPGHTEIGIEFRDSGRIARFVHAGETHELPFRREFLTVQIYANESHELRLDPEAFIYHDGVQIAAPCSF